MEAVVFEDSPLAQYLEGEGRAEEVANSQPASWRSSTILDFAPSLPTWRRTKSRNRPRKLALKKTGMVGHASRFKELCTPLNSFFHNRISMSKTALFLEQFRYSIVASQLLNQHSRTQIQSQGAGSPAFPAVHHNDSNKEGSLGITGLMITALCAFGGAWSLHYIRWNPPFETGPGAPIVLASFAILGYLVFLKYSFQQTVLRLQRDAIEQAEQMVSIMQQFDSLTSSALTFIQEVEVVSRGFSIGAPMPPVTRMEEAGDKKQCHRLRHSLSISLDSLYQPYYAAHQDVIGHTVKEDLEKYQDIYEISRMDVEDASTLAEDGVRMSEDAVSLQDLKVRGESLYQIRKLFLSTLLAVDADGSKMDRSRWNSITHIMRNISVGTRNAASRLEKTLEQEEEIPVSPITTRAVTPRTARARAQMRKVSSLLHGIRGLQAKLRLLREETDRALDEEGEEQQAETQDAPASKSMLIMQYDSIGTDLKNLLEEWNHGRALLAASHSRSTSTNQTSAPLSPTSSLSGTTVVEGSPQDAYRALTGSAGLLSGPSRLSIASSSSDEHVFEATALTRPRSQLSRKERVAKVKEDRLRMGTAKEQALANTHLLKELETVIKQRPPRRNSALAAPVLD